MTNTISMAMAPHGDAYRLPPRLMLMATMLGYTGQRLPACVHRSRYTGIKNSTQMPLNS